MLTPPGPLDPGQLIPPRHVRIGNLQLLAVTDGMFCPQPQYFSPEVDEQDHRTLFAPGQGPMSVLPIGCFLVTGIPGRLILIDAGMGPSSRRICSSQDADAVFYGTLHGGTLIDQLTANGVDPADITDVVVTHLHSDHCGWLGYPGSQPLANARIWVGAADYPYFQQAIDQPDLLGSVTDDEREYCQHQQIQLRELHAAGSIQLITAAVIAPGVETIPTPGHTPGHLAVSVTSEDERILLLGDAITCPIQLARPTWHSMGDVDVDAADRSRRHLWRELQRPGTIGVGAHFPELRPGHVYAGQTGLPAIWH